MEPTDTGQFRAYFNLCTSSLKRYLQIIIFSSLRFLHILSHFWIWHRNCSWCDCNFTGNPRANIEKEHFLFWYNLYSLIWGKGRGKLNISALFCVCRIIFPGGPQLVIGSAYMWKWHISRRECFWRELLLALLLSLLQNFRELLGAALRPGANGAQITIPLRVPLSDMDGIIARAIWRDIYLGWDCMRRGFWWTAMSPGFAT